VVRRLRVHRAAEASVADDDAAAARCRRRGTGGGDERARGEERSHPAAASCVAAESVSGSFHTKRCRGGVERRQMELKGIEGGD
jgi:hypothetical protein